MTLPDNTRIAGQKTVADWRAMKDRLNGCNGAAIWTEAFEGFFKERINSRYFEPIKAIEKMGKDVGEGFAIVTLHCSLIEFLASTLEGKSYRFLGNGAPTINEKIEYSNSRDMFVRFLKGRPPFAEMFPNESTAEDFYASVRCGLLHEARTKGTWKIQVCESAIQAIDARAKIVYRNKMQAAFDQFLDCYGRQLCTDAMLQQAFIRKIDSLCKK